MGLFSAKKKTYVSSVVYPLGEDGADRTDMLQYTVLNSILQNRSIAGSIRESFLRGQGISLRNAFRYARDIYTDGVPTSAARFSDQPDLTTLRTIVSGLAGTTVNLVTAMIASADFEWWADRYLAQTYGYDRLLEKFEAPPPGVEVNANVAYDLEPDGSIQILLMNADGAIKVLSFRPTDFVRMATYAHCAYQTEQSFDDGTTVTSRPVVPGEQARTTYSSVTVDRTGETQVTTSKTVVSLSGSTATDTVSKTTVVTSRTKYFLYRLGTGTYPVLDAELITVALSPPYFPSIPLRVDNVDWTDDAHQDKPLYKTSKKLLKKVGLDIDDLADKVNTNENINEIDYCFVAFGVRLNTGSPEGKKYLFRFFEYLRSISQVSSTQFTAWKDAYTAQFPTGPNASNLPPGGIQAPPTNSIEIYSAKDRKNNHDVKLQWQYIDTRLVSGTVALNAKPGTVTVSMAGAEQLSQLLNDMVVDSSSLVVRKQIDDNTYQELVVSGLTYENFIYAGKSVIVTAHDAMTDPDEDGFLVPLNQEILRATPLVEATNLSYQCMYLVFNCYKVVKQKWYQTTLFKIIIVIIAIIIIVVTWGSSTPAVAQGVAAVLAAGGAVTLSMMIIAATTYVLAAMVLSAIILKVATAAFGEKWGAIIGAIVSVVAMNYANAMASGGTSAAAAASSGSSLITAQNIIKASSALASAYLQHKQAGVASDMTKLESDYQTGLAKIEELTKLNLDTNMDLIDITGFTQAAYQNHYELADTFLSRTLLTGSDICDITSGLIENFVDVGLQLPTSG